MLIETLKFTVENSNTMDDLEESANLLKQKKRWLRKIALTPNNRLSSILFQQEKGEDLGIKHIRETIDRLNLAPTSVQDEFLSLAKDKENVEKMLKEVEELETQVTKKMKNIIWGIK